MTERVTIEFSNCENNANTSSVATDGHGWARAHAAPAAYGHGIRTDPKSFFLGGGGMEMEDGLGNKPA